MAHATAVDPFSAQVIDQVLNHFVDNLPINPATQKRAIAAMEMLVADLERKPCSILRDQIRRPLSNNMMYR